MDGALAAAGRLAGTAFGTELAIRRQLPVDAPATTFDEALLGRCVAAGAAVGGEWRPQPAAACTIKILRNQPALHDALRSLPWKEATARRYDRESGHGRRETRSVLTLTVDDLNLHFPHLTQAAKIHRHRTDIKTGKITRETLYAITDLPASTASPQTIGQLVRPQWSIEAMHHIRDTTFGEDASKIWTGHGPANMATLHSFAISTLRAAGHRSITAGLREVSYQPFTRPLDLIGLP